MLKMGWIMKQTWEYVLFSHWNLEPEQVRDLIPAELELDLFDGKAWLTMLPFKVSHQRFRFLPEIPFLNRYLELNVRTYVKHRGKAGVYFFSLDANHLPSVLGARIASLPYRLARISMVEQDQQFAFYCQQVFGNGEFSVLYEPVGGPAAATELGSLDHWLLERYYLFTKLGPLLLQGRISHESWRVCGATIKILANSISPVATAGEPQLVHFSPRKEAFIFPLKIVKG